MDIFLEQLDRLHERYNLDKDFESIRDTTEKVLKASMKAKEIKTARYATNILNKMDELGLE
jgi:hypothetical protein